MKNIKKQAPNKKYPMFNDAVMKINSIQNSITE